MLKKTVSSLILAGVCCTPLMAFAQHDDHHDNYNQRDDHHDDHHYVSHREWKRGYHMRSQDWGRGQRVDYRAHRLNTPPRGYEWREVDGNYVMAAVATGIIASVIASAGR